MLFSSFTAYMKTHFGVSVHFNHVNHAVGSLVYTCNITDRVIRLPLGNLSYVSFTYVSKSNLNAQIKSFYNFMIRKKVFSINESVSSSQGQ